MPSYIRFSAIVLLLAAIVLLLSAPLPSYAADTSGTLNSSVSNNPALTVDVNSGAVSVSAYSAVLIDARDCNILYAKNAAERLPMASTTKIMTAIIAIEYGDLNATVEIPSAAVGVEGSSIYLYTGEKLTLLDLLYALLLESANDAAAAIALTIAGSEEEFSHLMNDKAAELGLSDTRFQNPHGLDAEGHFTTAIDLARLSAYALKNETFAKIVSTRKTTIPLNGTEGFRLLINHNKMLRSYEGAIGVKTGYTRHSGRCLVSAAERDGLTLIAVTLNASNDWNDHRKMLDYGFSSYVSISLLGVGKYDLMMPLTGGFNEWVKCTNAEEVRVTLPKIHGVISCTVECPRFIIAPVKSGEAVGKIIYTCDGRTVGESELVTTSAAESKDSRRGFWYWLKSLFGFG